MDMTGIKRSSDARPSADEDLGFRPLYRQVRDTLIRRMVDGVWLPGQPLPSEMQLAAQLGVSQGTVRKALDAMAAENLVVRRQGQGTFVARHDEDRILFQFFKLIPDHGTRSFPQSTQLSLTTAKGSASEREMLELPRDGRVIRIRRVRSLEDKRIISELIVLPEARFPGLADMDLPNNLYGLYGLRFGISVAITREKLKAVGAPAVDAKALGITAGSPVLLIDRLALSLDQEPVEWRVSYCLTEDVHYESDLG